METQTTVTIVRLYIPEASHSMRKLQMEKVIHLLNDRLHVHGVAVLLGLKEAGSSEASHYESVSDVLRRNPDELWAKVGGGIRR